VGSLAYAIAQYSAKNPAAAQTLQNTIVPAIGWILSAREIKLATPAIISDTRQIVISTAPPTINFLALEFWTATTGFTIVLSNCAPTIAGFNRNACDCSREVDARRAHLKFAGDEKYIPGIFFGWSKP